MDVAFDMAVVGLRIRVRALVGAANLWVFGNGGGVYPKIHPKP